MLCLPSALSSLLMTAWFGMALPLSYSFTTCGFSEIFCTCHDDTALCTTAAAATTTTTTTTTVHTYTYIHPFNGPLSGTTQVSQYQIGKTNLDFTGARDSEWHWHQLGRMQVCTSLQTDNHASTPPISFYRPDALPAARPTASKHWRHDSISTTTVLLQQQLLLLI